jgi:predicted transcriptional regulator
MELKHARINTTEDCKKGTLKFISTKNTIVMKTEKNPKGAGRPSKTYKQKNLQKKVPLEMFRECIEALNIICKDYEKKHL